MPITPCCLRKIETLLNAEVPRTQHGEPFLPPTSGVPQKGFCLQEMYILERVLRLWPLSDHPVYLAGEDPQPRELYIVQGHMQSWKGKALSPLKTGGSGFEAKVPHPTIQEHLGDPVSPLGPQSSGPW